MKAFSITLLFIGLTIFCNGQNKFEDFVGGWRNLKITSHANVGVAVHDLTTGKMISGYNQDYSLVPASSMKLITSLVTLDNLGGEYRYQTYLGYDGKVGPDGTLQGNLYIIGSGDPTLGSNRIPGNPSYSQFLKNVLSTIKASGITCIDGDIVADESIFDSYPIAPSWQWNDLGNYYAGGAWGLNINENEYDIYFDSNYKVGSLSRLLFIDPKIPYLTLENEVLVDSANTGDNAYVFGGPYDFDKRIVGTIPQSKDKFKIKGSIPDPPKFLAIQIRDILLKNGIESNGSRVKIKKTDKNKHSTVIDTVYSPPLVEIVKYANYFSINQYCEALLKTLGRETFGEGSGGHGIRAIDDYLSKLNIDSDGLHMEDGSGLSARNFVNPGFLSEFLAKYAMKNGIEIMQRVMPKAGAEGTVSGLLGGYGARGNVWAKSGSMERVLSYSGICKAKSGKWISFSLIINGYQGKYKDMKPGAEKLIDKIYQMH